MEASRKLHLISFNVPYPADYGGVICVYHHLRALRQCGADIILHCFQYGREEAAELQALCSETHYYPRQLTPRRLLSSRPFIVNSRQHPDLLTRLGADNHPIVFEGTHCCHLLPHPRLAERRKVVRMHNVEWQYYRSLAALAKSPVKKAYFLWESQKLKRFELGPLRQHADTVLAISPEEHRYFQQQGFPDARLVPAFHPNDTVDILAGKGRYALFQGDLSVRENERAALRLLELFQQLPNQQLIVAGRQPSKRLRAELAASPNCELRQDVGEAEMDELLKNAQIHLLWAFQPAGMKLKLLNALYRGRFVLANDKMVVNSGLSDLCLVENNLQKWPALIRSLMGKSMTATEIAQRKNALDRMLSNTANAKKTLQAAFG